MIQDYKCIFFCWLNMQIMLYNIEIRNKIKAASSIERVPANGEKYAFKGVNIGKICLSNLHVPNFLLPASGAMTITEYWHIDVFRPGHLSNIWSLVQIEHGMFELV